MMLYFHRDCHCIIAATVDVYFLRSLSRDRQTHIAARHESIDSLTPSVTVWWLESYGSSIVLQYGTIKLALVYRSMVKPLTYIIKMKQQWNHLQHLLDVTNEFSISLLLFLILIKLIIRRKKFNPLHNESQRHENETNIDRELVASDTM